MPSLNPLLLLLIILPSALSSCTNGCNGKGTCNIYSECVCQDGFQGASCNERVCPFGNAFSDKASADDTAHALVECSGRGHCDRASGICTCMEGFTGKACDRTNCNGDCSGNGRCVSMNELAATTRDENSNSFTYSSVWDADKIYGCICDPGRTGYDCSLVECPTGDDPLTTGQVDEVQLLKCSSDPAEASSTFAIYFNGKVSPTIKASATAGEFEAALESIVGMRDLTVTFSVGATTICQTADTNVVQIKFNENFGSLSPLVAYTDDLLPIGSTIDISADGTTSYTDYLGTIHYSVKGTKEDEVCAGRGTCDYTTGSCECFTDNGDVYGSSNSFGVAGSRGDCGAALTSITNCPGETACSGFGNCATSTYKCSCQDGFYGGNCGLKECLKGKSWFAYPSANEAAHDDWVECSNMGSCDSSVGICECAPGFYGEACQYMACGGGTGNPCSGHGKCLSMRQLSFEADLNGDATDYEYGTDPNNPATWDADRVFGCSCDDGWEGYDCSKRSCPIGDDPGTYDDVREVQLIRCYASSGTFTLTFRQKVTAALSWDITADELKSALESLDSISSVDVAYTRNRVTSSTNSTYLPVTTCPSYNSGSPCEMNNKGTTTVMSSVTDLEGCKDACDGISGCTAFGWDASASSCSTYSIAWHNATSLSSDSTVQSYYTTADPLLIKGVNKIGICTNSTQNNVAVISFSSPSGDVPPITYTVGSTFKLKDNVYDTTGLITIATDGGTIGTETSVTGTTDEKYCSGRGDCSGDLGYCTCYSGWGSSDGKGGMGTLNDCGFRQNVPQSSS
mmetsp:Transcript_23907/g.49819  ORF Transcript_23907/g.49819 Transcript_23907/m.49819 type:complete len:798 (+) Transcript_23907:179-2572(+)